MLNDLANGKIDKTSIGQTDTVNDVNKVAGTPITYAHGQSISTINNNLGAGLKISSGRAVPNFDGTKATITLDKTFGISAVVFIQIVYNPMASFNATVSGNVLTITSDLTGSNTLDYLVIGV